MKPNYEKEYHKLRKACLVVSSASLFGGPEDITDAIVKMRKILNPGVSPHSQP